MTATDMFEGGAFESGEVMQKARQARIAAYALAKVDAATRASALNALADALIANQDYLMEQNRIDVDNARAKGTAESLIDRLLLTSGRIEDIAAALRVLADANDPIGMITEGRTLYNGIRLRRMQVPLGVVAMIYEARPNVTADAAGLCLKTANACLLRGGSLASKSNIAMTKVLYEAGLSAGLPQHWLQSIETLDRAATTELMQLHGLIDVLIPRGSASLIRSCVENAKVPVIETGEGNCHIYVHQAADPDIIVPIIINAKTQRPGVCNAAESILIDEAVSEQLLPPVIQALIAAGVTLHVDERVYAISQSLQSIDLTKVIAATEEDWGKEYLSLDISIACVKDIAHAIDHINAYSSHHSEAILSQDYTAVSRFLQEVDSAAVYANASTRFTDGGEFGLGAEIGISTQKLHARGPMGLTALTSTKFLLEGEGQIR